MLFNSVEFLFVFLPVVLAGFFLLARLRLRSSALLWLALASLAFYGWDDPYRLVPIILVSIAFNFAVGRMLLRRPTRFLLAVGIGGNLMLLGYFKYAAFLADLLRASTGLAIASPEIVLPLGISFFTFTQIAFLVDVSRREATEYQPHHYLLFVSFFPHLIAGPIYHHKEIMPQFDREETFRFDVSSLSLGLTWFALGLAKKVLLADPIAGYAKPVFASAAAGTPVGFVDAWIGALSFALQLYYDFSGYTDMAIGLALMIGIRFPLNFDSPYKATSLIDFWRRWHMTLSRFLRDYLYFPLGGNRMGPRRRFINLMIVMLLGGLWHGAAWSFVVWGGLHGLGLALNHAWRRLADPRGIVVLAPLAWLFTFGFVTLAWVPFRADDLPACVALWESMLGLGGFVQARSVLEGGPAGAVAWIAGPLALALLAPNTQQLMSYRAGGAAAYEPAPHWQPLRWHPRAGWALATGLLFGAALSFVLAQRPTEFLYFKF